MRANVRWSLPCTEESTTGPPLAGLELLATGSFADESLTGLALLATASLARWFDGLVTVAAAEEDEEEEDEEDTEESVRTAAEAAEVAEDDADESGWSNKRARKRRSWVAWSPLARLICLTNWSNSRKLQENAEKNERNHVQERKRKTLTMDHDRGTFLCLWTTEFEKNMKNEPEMIQNWTQTSNLNKTNEAMTKW